MVGFFLLFDLGVLVLNFYTSFQIAQDAVGINLSGRQRMLSQRTAKALLSVEAARLKGLPASEELDELRLFVNAVRHDFKVTTSQEPTITSAFLGTGDIQGHDFNGLVTFSGSYNGHVMVSMPGKLLRELLLLQHETDLSDANLLDAVGEIANTLAVQRTKRGLNPG